MAGELERKSGREMDGKRKRSGPTYTEGAGGGRARKGRGHTSELESGRFSALVHCVD